MKRNILLIYIAFNILLNLNGISEAEGKEYEKKIPLPIAEVETAVKRWLKNEGFTIYRTKKDMGRINYSASRKDVSWNITLEPNSPLASRVIVGIHY